MEEGESASLLMSLMHKMGRGPGMDPSGIPENVWHREERKPEIVTLCVRAVR